MANPDNRADNVQHLQSHLQHTLENIREAEGMLARDGNEMNGKDVEALEAKNERRKQAIEGFRNEIRDEAHD